LRHKLPLRMSGNLYPAKEKGAPFSYFMNAFSDVIG
jgi:hypothetical protein